MSVIAKPLRIIVEGPNCSGKSSFGLHLKGALPGATVIELHDCMHQHIIRQSKRTTPLISREDYMSLEQSTIDNAVAYARTREMRVLEFVDVLTYDTVIIERMLLTLCVYTKLLFGVNNAEYLRHIDEGLARRGFTLILLNAEIGKLLERSSEFRDKIPSLTDLGTPYHLTDPEMVRAKSECYDEVFSLLNCAKKMRFDTTKMANTQLRDLVFDIIENSIRK